MDSKVKKMDEAAPVLPTPPAVATDPIALLEDMAEKLAAVKGDEQAKLKQITDLEAQVLDLQAQLAAALAAQPVQGGLSQADVDKAVAAAQAVAAQTLNDTVKKVKDGAKAVISDLELKEQQAEENAKDQIDAL